MSTATTATDAMPSAAATAGDPSPPAERSLVAPTILMMGSTGLLSVLSAVAGLVLARALPVEEYGRMAYFSTVMLGVMLAVGFGLPAVAMTDLARARALAGGGGAEINRCVWSLLVLRVATAAPVVGVGWATAWATGDPLYGPMALCASLALVLDYQVGVLQGLQRIERSAAAFLIQPVAYLVLMVIVRPGSAADAFVLMAVTMAAAVVVVAVGLLGTGVAAPRAAYVSRAYLRGSVLLSGQITLIVLFQLGYGAYALLWLGAMGLYREAALLGSPLALVRLCSQGLKPVFYATFYPRWCTLVARGERAAARAHLALFFEGIGALMICATVAMMVFPGTIIELTYSSRYADAGPILIALAPLNLFIGLEVLLSLALTGLGEIKRAVVILAVRLAVFAALTSVVLVVDRGDPAMQVTVAYLVSGAVGLIGFVRAAVGLGVLDLAFGRLARFAGVCAGLALGARLLLPEGTGSVAARSYRLGVAAVLLGLAMLVFVQRGATPLRLPVPRRTIRASLLLAGMLIALGSFAEPGRAAPGPGATPEATPTAAPATSGCTGSVEAESVVVTCAPGFASERDVIRVYPRSPVAPGTGWEAAIEATDAVWVFEIGAKKATRLIIDFRPEGSGVVAEVYGDGDGDGEVAYLVRAGIPVVTESEGRWNVRVTAPDGWWTRDGTINYNLDWELDGPIRGTFYSGFGYDVETLLARDGDIDFEIHVRDFDRDGRPDLEWRQDRTPLPENRFISGQYRTEIQHNTHDDEVPVHGFVFWPFLAEELHSFNKQYNQSPAPIMVDWETGRVVAVTEIVASRGNPGNYFIYSIARVIEGELTETDFENPFGFHDWANANDGWPDGIIRMEHLLPHTLPSLVVAPDNETPINIVQYAWDQWHEHRLTYQVSMAGRHTLDRRIDFPEFSVATIPFEEMPDWAIGQTWDAATFVQIEKESYWTAEAVYEWTVEEGDKQLPFYYITGNRTTEPTAGFSAIPEGFRGEYQFNLNDVTKLYFSPVDRKLHMVRPQAGIWNLGDGRLLRSFNAEGGDHLDGWQRWDGGLLTAQLYRVPGGLLYSDARETLFRAVELPAELFRTLPPTDHAEWAALGALLKEHERVLPPGDLRAMFDAAGGDAIRVAAAPLADFRRLDGGGIRFVISGTDAYSRGLLSGLAGAPLAAGSYVVARDAAGWQVTPGVAAAPVLAIDLVEEARATTAKALHHTRVRVEAANPGAMDLGRVRLIVEATGPGGSSTNLARRDDLTLEGAAELVEELVWTPAAPGAWRVEARIERTGVGEFAAAPVVVARAAFAYEVAPAPSLGIADSAAVGWATAAPWRLAGFAALVLTAATIALIAVRTGGRPT